LQYDHVRDRNEAIGHCFWFTLQTLIIIQCSWRMSLQCNHVRDRNEAIGHCFWFTLRTLIIIQCSWRMSLQCNHVRDRNEAIGHTMAYGLVPERGHRPAAVSHLLDCLKGEGKLQLLRGVLDDQLLSHRGIQEYAQLPPIESLHQTLVANLTTSQTILTHSLMNGSQRLSQLLDSASKTTPPHSLLVSYLLSVFHQVVESNVVLVPHIADINPTVWKGTCMSMQIH